MLLTTPARSTPHPLSVMAPGPHIPPRHVLSEADQASRWGMSPKILQRWRMQGRGPHYLKLSKRVNYPLNAVSLSRTASSTSPPHNEPLSKEVTP